MSEEQAFPGFPDEGIRFFEKLARNNNREWFQEYKQDYLDFVQTPAQDFVVALGSRLKAISRGIEFDDRTSGAGSIMRIYRDVRFSKDKTPYKTFLGIVFWEGPRKKMENPGFYFHLDPGGGALYVGFHGFPKPFLRAYREAVIDDKLGPRLVSAMRAIEKYGDYEIGREHYKRVPSGYDKEHERADLLRYDSLYAMSSPIDVDTVTSPKLIDVCFEHCRRLAPIHHWLVELESWVD